jgi:hypothetical protein
MVTVPQLGWSCVNLNAFADLESLGDLLRLAWDQQRQLHPAVSSNSGSSTEPTSGSADSSEEIVDSQTAIS